MAKRIELPLSFRAGVSNTEAGVVDHFSQIKRPKLKFNFTVSFKFREPILILGNKPDNSMMEDELTFALKQASRPNPTIVYQDVNYYNYRTKVATKVDYGALNLTLYDDVENFGHNIYEQYLKTISPIANVRKEQVNDKFSVNQINGPKNQAFNTQGVLQDTGETITATTLNQIDGGTGSVGPLGLGAGGEQGLIENITLRHWFWSDIERRGDEGDVPQIQYVEYQYLNPKIINMTLDEVDMTQSDVSTIMMNFVYDSVFIDSPQSVNLDIAARQTDGSTFTINDIRGKINDVERLVRRIRRLDTLPDIGVINAASTIIPPISGTLPNIQLPRPIVDIFDVTGV